MLRGQRGAGKGIGGGCVWLHLHFSDMGDDTLHPFEAAERQKGRILTILRMTLLVMLVTVIVMGVV